MRYTKAAGVLLCACALGLLLPGKTKNVEAEEGLRIVTTIFPCYDWITCVLGENPADISVDYLLDSGVDLHSFQPTVDDMMEIASCDLFVYVGGESDKWVKDALTTTRSEDLHTLCLMDVLGDAALEEETVEGMQVEEEEEEEEGAKDEHIWLSLKNAALCADAICEAVSGLDEENASLYQENTAAFKEKLSALDEEYKEAVENASLDTLVFGDRFPFRYLLEDYDLNYYAAFAGCSAETEASFETIIFLSQKAEELGVPCILTIEGSDQKVAQTIVDSTKNKNIELLSMDSMQSASSMEKDGYLAIMEENLEVLKKALNERAD